MSLSKFTGDTSNIQSLPDQPSISASELKAKFDKTGADIKEYINNTLTEEIDENLDNKANSNEVYKKTETEALINGTILLENDTFPYSQNNRIFLNDSIESYKCIEIILESGPSFKLFKEVGEQELRRTINYINQISVFSQSNIDIVCSNWDINILENRLDVRKAYFKDILVYWDSDESDNENNFAKIKELQHTTKVSKIIGYK
jgi:hypothetical protein